MTNTLAAQRSFVAYYRVSTIRQGVSRLGLDAQRLAVSAYLATVAGSQCIAELTKIESGKRKDRPQLAEAMKIARQGYARHCQCWIGSPATSIFVSGLMESGIKFVACDSPCKPPYGTYAGRFRGA